MTDAAPKRRRAGSSNRVSDRMESNLSSVGGRLAWARLRQGMTQKALADLSGKVRTTIAQYEADKIHPPVAVIDALAETLKVSPEFIAFGDADVRPASTETDAVMIRCVRLSQSVEVEEGSASVPAALADELGLTAEGAIIRLEQPVAEHQLQVGDRIVVNREANIAADGRLYALRSSAGIEVVRSEPSLTAAPSKLTLTGGSGQTYHLAASDIQLIGLVTGVIRRV